MTPQLHPGTNDFLSCSKYRTVSYIAPQHHEMQNSQRGQEAVTCRIHHANPASLCPSCCCCCRCCHCFATRFATSPLTGRNVYHKSIYVQAAIMAFAASKTRRLSACGHDIGTYSAGNPCVSSLHPSDLKILKPVDTILSTTTRDSLSQSCLPRSQDLPANGATLLECPRRMPLRYSLKMRYRYALLALCTNKIPIIVTGCGDARSRLPNM